MRPNHPLTIIIMTILLMTSNHAVAQDLERKDLFEEAVIAQKSDRYLDAIKNLYAYMRINEDKLSKKQIIKMESAIQESEGKLRATGLSASARIVCPEQKTGKIPKAGAGKMEMD